MAKIDKRTRNRRLTGLVVVVAAIVLVLVLLIRWGCGGSDSTTAGDPSTDQGDVVIPVGEPVARADASVMVSAFASAATPVLPTSPAALGPKPAPGEGQTFHQAFVWFENSGDDPVRVDPLDFSLVVDGESFPPDLTRSGPAARTLLHGASMDLTLTFIGPAEGTARLSYQSSWSQGTILFEGQQKPAGMAGAVRGVASVRDEEGRL